MANLKLFYVPRTRAGRARWMLEELELPYDLVRVDAKAERTPAHLAAHPLGAVPALVDEESGATLFESAAIVAWLSEKTGRLAPTTPKARATYLQWLFFGMATLEPLVVDIQMPEDKRNQARSDEAHAKLARWVAALERALAASGDYLCGDFSGADVVVGGTLIWASFLGVVKDAPRVEAYVKRLKERPAWQRARAD